MRSVIVAAGVSLFIADQSGLSLGQPYAFLDTIKTSTMQKELDRAGASGYDIHAASALSVLLKRGDESPRTFKLIATERAATFESELNAVAAQGHRLVPESAMEFADEVIAVLKKAEGGPWAYKTLRGGENDTAALTAAMKEGWRYAAVMVRPASEFSLSGKPRITFVLERNASGPASGAAGGEQYKVLQTARTGTLAKEIKQAATEGYRVVGAGYMTVIMYRGAAADQLNDYELLAARRLSAIEKETNEAATKGFRIVPRGLMVNGAQIGELIFVMERAPGSTQPHVYSFLDGGRKTAEADLARMVSEGYTPVALLGRLIVLEKASKTP